MKTYMYPFFWLAMILLVSGHSEPVAQELFYRHYEGKVGENIHLVADLMNFNGNLTGYYYYYYNDQDGDSSWTHYGKSLNIDGKVGEGNAIEFTEANPGEKGPVFKGTIADNKITGTWSDNNYNRSLPFELVEKYPAGVLPFEVHHLKGESFLVPGRQDAKASFEICLALPVPATSSAIKDSITKAVIDHLFGLEYLSKTPDELLRQERDVYFRNYHSSNREIYKEGAQSFNWEKIEIVRIPHNERMVLSLEFFDYGFTGGAHGLGISKFQVFDLRDGHTIGLEEIFRTDFRNDLREIISDQVRDDYRLQPGQSLVDAGFFQEVIEPSDNFYINSDGIGFYYNPYEAAPYAHGPIDVFIPYRKIKRIMDPKGYIYQFSEKNNLR